jgi:F-type H+-transporting ATPase subunit beta
VNLVTCAQDATEDQRRALPRLALQRARQLLDAGTEHVLLTIFEAPGYRADVRALYADLRAASPGSITTLLVTPWNEVGQQVPDVAPPIGGHLRFDRALAAALAYPALDPLHSIGADLPEPEAEVMKRARGLLAELRAVAPDLRPELDALPDEQRLRMARALRVQAYLTQPFHGTEPFTARPGVSVARAHAVERIRAILDGAHDDTPLDSLLYGPD